MILLLDILGTIWFVACLLASYLLFRFMRGATRGFVLALLDVRDEFDE